MNIALSAVVIFILLIPPIAFYLCYTFVNRQSKAGPKFSLLDGILASSIISLFVHALALALIQREIRFDILLKLLGGELKDVETKISNHEFVNALKDFAFYNLSILIISCLLGYLTRLIIIRFHFDTGQHELTRLHNRWFYLFNGIDNNIQEFDLVLIDAVVDTNDGTVIYSGFLIDYVCFGEQLDRIYLDKTVRRAFKRNTVTDNGNILENIPGEPMDIPGNVFSLAYDKTINLNLRFLLLDDSIKEIEQLPEEHEDKPRA